MKICYRHFRSRCQKKLISAGCVWLKSVHIHFKFWQLRRPDHAIAAHQKWWTDLEIPVLARVQIEHELDKSTLQPRPGAGKTNKSAATELRGALEIEQLKPGSDDNVIERICNFGFRSPLPHHQIRAWIPSDRSIRVWQVRNLEEEIAFFFISRGRLFAQRGDLITNLADTVFERSGIFTAA